MRKAFLFILGLCVILSTSVQAEAPRQGTAGQRVVVAWETLRAPTQDVLLRVKAAETVLTLAKEQNLESYLGMPGGLKVLHVDGGSRVNVTYVGHKFEKGLAPLRPDIQVHLEIAALLLVKRFQKEVQTTNVEAGSQQATDRTEKLVRLARVSSAVVGARALDEGEAEVWALIREKIVANPQIQNEKEILALLEDHSKNVGDLANTLRALSDLPWVPTEIAADIKRDLEARL